MDSVRQDVLQELRRVQEVLDVLGAPPGASSADRVQALFDLDTTQIASLVFERDRLREAKNSLNTLVRAALREDRPESIPPEEIDKLRYHAQVVAFVCDLPVEALRALFRFGEGT